MLIFVRFILSLFFNCISHFTIIVNSNFIVLRPTTCVRLYYSININRVECRVELLVYLNSFTADMEFLEVLTEGMERVLMVRGGGSEVITIYS